MVTLYKVILTDLKGVEWEMMQGTKWQCERWIDKQASDYPGFVATIELA